MAVTLRNSNVRKLREHSFDVLVVGGGINGAVAAASLAGRGVRVALIDRGDFASGVSSNSSNLAWGGVKYLESFEFGLVRKLCMSRNRLIRAYPSSVREIRFFVTLARSFRWPRLFLWLGTWLYWLMGNLFTRAPRLLGMRPPRSTSTPAARSSSWNWCIASSASSVGGFWLPSACPLIFTNNMTFIAVSPGDVRCCDQATIGTRPHRHSREDVLPPAIPGG